MNPSIQLPSPTPKTFFLLMAQYDAKAVISVKEVCRDYFTHLSPEIFLRKVALGDIKIPVIRMDGSNKGAKGVHLQDLASYIDKQRYSAQKESHQLNG